MFVMASPEVFSFHGAADSLQGLSLPFLFASKHINKFKFLQIPKSDVERVTYEEFAAYRTKTAWFLQLFHVEIGGVHVVMGSNGVVSRW